MVNSLRLFNLIQSLSKTEKRYLKLSVGFHKGEKVYLKLFEIIDKQKLFDEVKIKGEFLNQTSVKQYSVVSNYLYHQILKSLNAFYAGESAESKIREMLGYAEVLLRKDLNEEAILMLKRAKELSIKYENYFTVLQIDKTLRELEGAEETMALQNEDANYMRLIKKTDHYIRLNEKRSLTHTLRTRTRTKLQDKEYATILNNPWLKNEKLPVLIEDRFYFYRIRSMIYFINHNWEKAFEYYQKTLKLLDFNKHLLTEKRWQKNYCSTLTSSIGVISMLKLVSEGEEATQKLLNLKYASKPQISMSASNLISLYLNTNKYDSALAFIKKNEKILVDAENFSNNYNLSAYYLNLTELYFVIGQVKKSHFYVQKIINNQIVDSKQDIICIARIIDLVLLFEMNNTVLLESNIHSATRFLNKRKSIYQFETVMLAFFKQVIKNSTDKKNDFNNLKKNLKSLLNNSYEKKVFDYFDFISWVESKIENRPFIEILKEKYNG